MKKILFLTAVLFLLIAESRSQSVGINFNGASPNSSGALDIDVSALGTKKGLLIPRVTLANKTAMNPLPAAAQGLLVYQTDGVEGFYYNTSLTTTPNWIYLYNAGTGVRWDQLQSPTSNLNLNHGAYSTIMTFNGVSNASAYDISSNSLTSGDLLHLNVTSTTAPASGQVGVLSVNKSGALANSNVTSAGVYSSVTNTGSSSTNLGGYFFASGATNNYGIKGTTDMDFGKGVYGENTSSGNGVQYGIYAAKTGNSSTGTGIGIYATAQGTGGNNTGASIYATGASTNTGVQVVASGISSTSNIGGDFYAAGASTTNVGVQGTTDANFGRGINGLNYSTGTGVQYGIYAAKTGNTGTGTGIGIYATAQGTGANNTGASIYATGASTNTGVQVVSSGISSTSNIGGDFYAAGASTTNIGVQGTTDANFGRGINGLNYSTGTGVQYGIYAAKIGNTGTGTGIGIYATAQGTGANNTGASIYATGASTNTGVQVVSSGISSTSNIGGDFYAAGASTTNIGVQGTTDANFGRGINGLNYSIGTGVQYGIYAAKTGNTGTGTGIGIYATAQGTGTQNDGASIYATGATNNYGVEAVANGVSATLNIGGSFYAAGASTTNIGVQGTTDANNGKGIFGSNYSNGAGLQYGIYATKIGNTGTGAGYAIYGAASGTGAANIGGYFTASGATTNYAAIFDQGNVGMGCTTPQYKLHVIGDIAASGILRASSAVVSTTISACSDIRYKKNVTPLQNSLSNLLKLQGVTYYWKTKEFPDKYFNDQKQIGVIAQELEKIYPELVMTDKDGYKSVDYSKITPVLIEAIKDQQKEITDLTARINKLEQLITNSPK